MKAVQHPLNALKDYLPEEGFEPVIYYIKHYKIHLTITEGRKSVLGDYRHASFNKNHRISINGNLNKFEFLITFLHELAHLLTFMGYGNKVEPHGPEWKHHYRLLLNQFIMLKAFPEAIENVLKKTLINPSATANGETELLLVLRKFNRNEKYRLKMIQEIPFNACFKTHDGRIFKKLNKKRTRYACIELKTGLNYLFSAVYEVLPVDDKK